MSGSRMDVVIKVSERCNLACPYYFQEFDNSAYARFMSFDVVRQLADFLGQGLSEVAIDRLNLVLHGGEPLLLKKSRFDAACRVLRDTLEDRVDLCLSVQTNGVLIDEEWIDIFSRHRINVGVSIDGPKEHHDRMRPDKRGRGSFDKTLRGIRMVQEAASAGRVPSYGVLCVANPALDGREVSRFFAEELELPSFTFLLPRTGWGEGIEDAQAEWIRFFGEALDYWEEKYSDKLPPHNQILSPVLHGMMSDDLANVIDSHFAWRHHVISISSEGHLGADDNLMALDPRYANTGMSIFDTSLGKFLESDFWRSLIDSVDYVPPECSGCEWYRTCRSGELYNRYSREDGLQRRSVFCETIDYINFRIAQYLVRRGLKLPDLARRLGARPTVRAQDVSGSALRVPRSAAGVDATHPV